MPSPRPAWASSPEHESFVEGLLPLLKPSKKLFAEVSPYHSAQSDANHPNVHVLGDLDETSYFDSVEEDLATAFERITGEAIGSSR